MDQDQWRGRCRIRTEQLAGGAIGRLVTVTAQAFSRLVWFWVGVWG